MCREPTETHHDRNRKRHSRVTNASIDSAHISTSEDCCANQQVGKRCQATRSPEGRDCYRGSSATGWQAHSVRAYLSGLRKKGRALLRELRKDGTSTYRLVAAVASPLAGFAVDDGPASQPDTGTDPVTAKFEA
jgi:hypothetical protein